MKTYKQLFDQITAFDNLWLAARNARKGKQLLPAVARFEIRLADELLQLQEELMAGTYYPGRYRSFYIQDPKKRLISAAPYRDRVVHHALCQVICPLFERTFISDTYANRKGKGTHKAMERYQYYARRYPYVLKCDIQKFFPTIDHALLKRELRWKIACPQTLALIDSIIDNSNEQDAAYVFFPGDDLFTPTERRRGLPIGNLTSQWWGNIMLNRFDHFVKEELRVPGYIRYVDDFVLFGDSKMRLWTWAAKVHDYLSGLRLVLHPDKTQVYPVAKGVTFLGFRLYPHYRVVDKRNTRRYRRCLRKRLRQMQARELSPQALENGLNSWLGHVRFGYCSRLTYRIYWYLRQQGVELFRHPRGSWRVLE